MKIKQGVNYLVSRGWQKVLLGWHGHSWAVLRLPLGDEMQVLGAKIARTCQRYTRADLDELQAAGWEFKETS